MTVHGDGRVLWVNYVVNKYKYKYMFIPRFWMKLNLYDSDLPPCDKSKIVLIREMYLTYHYKTAWECYKHTEDRKHDMDREEHQVM